MFGDVAIQLLKMMGHGGTIPGAIFEEDAQPALDRLKVAIKAQQESQGNVTSTGEDDDEPAASLSQ